MVYIYVFLYICISYFIGLLQQENVDDLQTIEIYFLEF